MKNETKKTKKQKIYLFSVASIVSAISGILYFFNRKERLKEKNSNSIIGLIRDDGSVIYTFCKHNGLDNLTILNKNYRNEDIIDRLIRCGFINCLEPLSYMENDINNYCEYARNLNDFLKSTIRFDYTFIFDKTKSDFWLYRYQSSNLKESVIYVSQTTNIL